MKKPIEYQKSFSNLLVSELDVDTTQNYKDDVRSKYAYFWMAVFMVDFLAQCANKSLVLLASSEIQSETKPIQHKWTGKLKPGLRHSSSHRTTIGCSQRPGIDYGETFAPVHHSSEVLSHFLVDRCT